MDDARANVHHLLILSEDSIRGIHNKADLEIAGPWGSRGYYEDVLVRVAA